MTREEAISNLASAMDLINGIDHVLWESIEALVTDASPDPIPGLVPCGCGGVAISEDYFGDDDVESSYRAFVSCEKCELRTPDYPRLFDAKEAWNTAMGYTPPGANSPEIEWISVKDRLPDPGERVIATDGEVVGEAYNYNERWFRAYGLRFEFVGKTVKYWMPMPKPPEENTK